VHDNVRFAPPSYFKGVQQTVDVESDFVQLHSRRYYMSLTRKNLPDVLFFEPQYAVWVHWMDLCHKGCEPGNSKPFFGGIIRDIIPIGHPLLWDGKITLANMQKYKKDELFRPVDEDGFVIDAYNEIRSFGSEWV